MLSFLFNLFTILWNKIKEMHFVKNKRKRKRGNREKEFVTNSILITSTNNSDQVYFLSIFMCCVYRSNKYYFLIVIYFSSSTLVTELAVEIFIYKIIQKTNIFVFRKPYIYTFQLNANNTSLRGSLSQVFLF